MASSFGGDISQTAQRPPKMQRGNVVKEWSRDFGVALLAATIGKSMSAPLTNYRLGLHGIPQNPEMAKRPQFARVFDNVLVIAKIRNISFFWDGNFVRCFNYAPYVGLLYATNDALRWQLEPVAAQLNPSPEFKLSVQMGCGFVTGGAAAALQQFADPPEIPTRKGYFVGLSGMERLPGIFGVAMYRGVELGCFYHMQEQNPYRYDKGMAGVVSTFGIANAARMLALVMSYPIQVSAQRMIVDAPASGGGAVNCFLHIVKQEGLKGLYKGGRSAVLSLTGSVVLTMYDRMQLTIDWTHWGRFVKA